MKTIMVNNFNYLRGGAETVFLSEIELLRKMGNEVAVFSRRHSKNLSADFERFFPSEMFTDSLAPTAKGLRSLMGLLYSFEAKRCLNTMLNSIEVDVAHVHNIYGRLTTSILDALNRKGIPVVMTLHDYKVICPNYKLMHHGKICEDCRGDRYYQAVLNRCHKNSLIASAIYSFETFFNFIFNKYRKNIRYFISPSYFLKNKLVEFGWPEHKIVHIPNFYPVENFDPNYNLENYFLYLGRLSSEKGIETLIQAFLKLKNFKNVQLKIAGEGPLEQKLKKMAASDKRILFLGYLTGAPLADITKKALAVVVPSEWYENAPLSVLEAMAYGKPVIGARIGGIPEMISDGRSGLLFKSGDAMALTKVMQTILDMNPGGITDMGRRARIKVEEEYNSELHYNRLMVLYRRAIKESKFNLRNGSSISGCLR